MAAWLDYLPFTLAVLPGAYAWWSGRRLLRFIDDPAVNERALARAGQVTQVAVAALVAMGILGSFLGWLVPVVILGIALGSFPARRRLLDERWGFGQYLAFSLRLWIAWGGFWILLATAPSIVTSVVGVEKIAAVVLAGLLSIWLFRFHSFFAAIIGVRPLPVQDFHRTILQRSQITDATLYRVPVPGGRLANAWALPTRPQAGVAFTDTLLESLTQDEQAAILAHELAHLERIANTRQKRWIEYVLITVLILLGTFGPVYSSIARWTTLIWGVFVLMFFVWLANQSRKVEIASDRRAVEICGDASALVRGLTKLTLLARFPRRWSLEFETRSTHPSLANRIRAIRETSGAAPATGTVTGAPSSEIVIVRARSNRVVLLGPDQLELLEGVPTGTPTEADAMRSRARRRISFAYSALADLRVAAGLRATPSLLMVEVTGKVWKIPLEPQATSLLQAALDHREFCLGKVIVPSQFHTWGGRAMALALLVLVWGPTMRGEGSTIHITSLAAGLGCLVSPGPVAFLALSFAAAGVALTYLLAASSSVTILFGLGSLLVAAVASVLIFRSRGMFYSRSSRFTPPIFFGIATLGFWGPLAAYLIDQEEPFALVTELLRSAPDIWVLPLTFASVLLMAIKLPVKRVVGSISREVWPVPQSTER